jgi:hypothetical protein
MQNTVTIATGIDGNEQESSYMNGTLQPIGNGQWAMTIHAYLEVPQSAHASQAAVSAYVRQKLKAAAAAVDGLTFEVEIGPYSENGAVSAAADWPHNGRNRNDDI